MGRKHLLTCAAIVLGSWLGAVPQARAESKPLLHWTFDEEQGNVRDDGVLPAMDGTFTGVAGRTTDTPNRTGLALNLGDGAKSASVTAGAVAKLEGLSAMTVTFWINFRGNPKNEDRYLRHRDADFSGADFWEIQMGDWRDGKLVFFLGGTDKTERVVQSLNSDSTGPLKRWVFVAPTCDSTAAQFWTGSNDVAVAKSGDGKAWKTPLPIRSNAGIFEVGGLAASASAQTSPAWMDDVRVYDAALTREQLEQVRRFKNVEYTPARKAKAAAEPAAVAPAPLPPRTAVSLIVNPAPPMPRIRMRAMSGTLWRH